MSMAEVEKPWPEEGGRGHEELWGQAKELGLPFKSSEETGFRGGGRGAGGGGGWHDKI